MTIFVCVIFCKGCDQRWFLINIFLVFQWDSYSVFHFSEICFQVFQIILYQFCYPGMSVRLQICGPNVLRNVLGQRLWGRELNFQISMNTDLIWQQQIQANIKIELIKYIISNSKERITLNIQIHGNIPSIPHFLINFLNFIHKFQLLLLCFYIINKILFLFSNNSRIIIFFLIL